MFAIPFASIKKPEEHFLELGRQIEQKAAQWGVKIRATDSPELKIFRRLSNAKKLRVLQSLQHQFDFFSMLGTDVRSKQNIWLAIKKMGLVPAPDIFDKLADEDVIEIYLSDHTSSFKNLRFFELISMTLEEVYCLEWFKQIQVNPKLLLYFLELGIRLSSGQVRQTFQPRFNRYRFFEKSGEKRHIEVNLKWISPLQNVTSGVYPTTRALLFVNQSRVVNAGTAES